MAGPWEAYQRSSAPTLQERGAVADIGQSGASAEASRASAEATRAKMLADQLANKRRRATPAEVKAQGLDPNLSYQIDGLGRFILNPGQVATKKPLADASRGVELQSALAELDKAEKMAKEGFLTVGRPAEIITGLPLIGGLIDQPRVDFEATNEAVKARLIQDAITKLALINQGGVTGMVNTPIEAQRMAAAIANLDPSQSREQYLRQTKRVRDYYTPQLKELADRYPPKTALQSAEARAKADLVARVRAEQAKRARERALKGQK